MDLLIVTATEAEAVGSGIIPDGLGLKAGDTFSPEIPGYAATLLVTGPGQAATAFELGRHLVKHRYRMALNLGIAGSLVKEHPPGSCGMVINDEFADLGAEDVDGLLSVFELGLYDPNQFPFQDGRLRALIPYGWKLPQLPQVNGVTLNRAHGRAHTVEEFRTKFPGAEYESMEGAAFYYACLKSNQPCIQIRAISNYVGPRDRSSWEIGKALNNLKHVVQDWLILNRTV